MRYFIARYRDDSGFATVNDGGFDQAEHVLQRHGEPKRSIGIPAGQVCGRARLGLES